MELDGKRPKRKYLVRPLEARASPRRRAVPRRPFDAERVAVELFQRGRHELIAEAAYYLGLSRAGQSDNDRDWLEAEAQIDAMLRGRQAAREDKGELP